MPQLVDQVLENYFVTHRELIATEQVDESNVIVSFPFHYVGNHRVELSITKATGGLFLISDVGHTIGELKEYGYAVSQRLLARMVQIAKPANVRIVNENMVMDCRPEEVGVALHNFAEAAKTIGDAYLAFHVKAPSEKRLIEEVRALFSELQIAYKLGQRVHGKLDTHPVDFYIPPNGHAGLALGVLGGYNTHTTAQVWYFKSQDMRAFNSRLKVEIVYDIEESNWSERSQAILSDAADFALPSSELRSLGNVVKSTVS